VVVVAAAAAAPAAAAAGLVAAGSAAGSAAAAAGAFAGRSAMADMQPSRRGYAPTVIFGVRDGAMVEDGVGIALARPTLW
jgi:hypothetical protein